MTTATFADAEMHPTTSEPSPKFWDKIAKRYAARALSDPEAYQTKLEITREYMRPTDQVLEIGCGTGSTAIAHAPFVAEIRATDLSDAMLRIAGERAHAAGVENVTFERAAVETLEGAPASYDMVMAHSLLHLIEDRPGAIRRAWDLLKPGGYFVTSTTCIADQLPLFRIIAPVGRWLGFFPYVAVFRETTLQQEMEAQGFELVHRFAPKKKSAIFLVCRKPA